MRTNYQGTIEGTFFSLPWGDGSSATVGGMSSNQDNAIFASLDADTNSSGAQMSEHAQFRNYSFQQGRWLAPDPYDGSYDSTNPQSLNRYAYVLNNPLSFTDPSGLCDPNEQPCPVPPPSGPDPCVQNPLACYGGGSGGNGLCMWFGYCPGTQNNTGGGSPTPQPAPKNVTRPFSRTFPCGTNAAGAIGNLENNFAANADWSAGPLSVTFLQQGALSVGGPIFIDGILGAGHWYSGIFPSFASAGVSVTSVGSNSFTFTTIPGMHPFDNGSVTFSASDVSNGNINFSVNVNANFSGLGSEGAFYLLGGSISEASIWNHLIDNVQAGCHN